MVFTGIMDENSDDGDGFQQKPLETSDYKYKAGALFPIYSTIMETI